MSVVERGTVSGAEFMYNESLIMDDMEVTAYDQKILDEILTPTPLLKLLKKKERKMSTILYKVFAVDTKAKKFLGEVKVVTKSPQRAVLAAHAELGLDSKNENIELWYEELHTFGEDE
tara:strand:+ start:323 stop:676 length:354 start_codon:yes stop_codon:yes gene_type:complete